MHYHKSKYKSIMRTCSGKELKLKTTANEIWEAYDSHTKFMYLHNDNFFINLSEIEFIYDREDLN